MKIARRFDIWLLVVIALAVLGGLIYTTLQLLDQSERHVKEVTKVKMAQRDANTWIPRANECDLQVKRDVDANRGQTELRYSNFEFTEEGFKQIARLHRLKKLYLLDCDVKDDWLKHLEKLPLSYVVIEGTDITAKAIDHLAKIRTLDALGVSRCPIDDSAVAKLWALPKLTSLNLAETDVTNAGVRDVVKLTSLESFSLMGSPVTGDCLADVAKLPKLRTFDFGQVQNVTAQQIRPLRDLKNLWSVNFRRCDLKDDALKELALFPRNVQQMVLSRNHFTDRGLDYLKGTKHFSLIRLEGCDYLSPGAVAKLKKSLPGCIVDFKGSGPLGEFQI